MPATGNEEREVTLKRLETDPNWEVADNSSDIRGWTINDGSGTAIGKIDGLLFEPSDNRVHYAIADLNGRKVQVPIGDVDINEGSRSVRLQGYDQARVGGLTAFEETAAYSAPTTDVRGNLPQRIQLLEEQLRVGKRSTQIGEVVATKHAVSEVVEQDVTLMREEVDIQRIPVNEPARAGERIGEGNETIKVSLFAEEPVVEKKTFVKEEVAIDKHQETRTEKIREDVKREELTFASGEPTQEELRRREISEGRLTSDEQLDVLPDDNVRRNNGLL